MITFTVEDLDTRLCDYNTKFKSTKTFRQSIHNLFKYNFGKDNCNDTKLNSLSNFDLNRIVKELLYVKKIKQNKREWLRDE